MCLQQLNLKWFLVTTNAFWAVTPYEKLSRFPKWWVTADILAWFFLVFAFKYFLLNLLVEEAMQERIRPPHQTDLLDKFLQIYHKINMRNTFRLKITGYWCSTSTYTERLINSFHDIFQCPSGLHSCTRTLPLRHGLAHGASDAPTPSVS